MVLVWVITYYDPTDLLNHHKVLQNTWC